MSRFPFQPLEDLVADADLDRVFGDDIDVLSRWWAEGFTLEEADELAVRAGFHPGTIWPSWWDYPGGCSPSASCSASS